MCYPTFEMGNVKCRTLYINVHPHEPDAPAGSNKRHTDFITQHFLFKKNRKVEPVHVRKAHTGIRGTAPRIRNLATRRRSVQHHAPAALLPGNTPVSTEAGWAPKSTST